MHARFCLSLGVGAMTLAAASCVTQARDADTTLCITKITVVDVVGGKFLRNQEIFVRGDSIERVGPQPTPHTSATRVIDGSRLIALPGFIDTHTHLWQHVVKSVAPDRGLQEWARAVYPAAHYLTREHVHDITLAAAAQASLSGITTVVDFASCNFSEYALDATINGLADAGLDGAVIWWTPAAFLPPRMQEREIARLAGINKSRFQIWIGPSALSFFELPVVHHGIALAKQTGCRLAEHTMENVQEQRDLATNVAAYLEKYGDKLRLSDSIVLRAAVGRTPLPKSDSMMELRRQAEELIERDARRLPTESERTLSEKERLQLSPLVEEDEPSPVPILELFGALPNFLAIHSVWPNDHDIDAFAKYNVSVSLNPESNMYLASGVPPLANYRSRGINFSLGTDGAASNDGIDFFSAMRAAWNLQKVDMLDPETMKSINAWDILRAATINGARAMGLAELTGSLDPGKQADLVLLSLDRLGLAPFRGDDSLDASLIVNSAGVRDVACVISNGHIIVQDGQLVAQDESRLARRLSDTWAEVLRSRTDGKVWKEEIELTGESSTFLRYRSVRPKDEVNILLTNRLDHEVEALVAKSGATFGGSCAAMLSPDVLARTPLDRIERAPDGNGDPGAFYKQWRVKLGPGQLLHFRKSRGEIIYRLSTPIGEIEEKVAKAEQLLFLVE